MKKGLVQADSFDWDDGNRSKNWHKHRVTDKECEEVFTDPSLKIAKDVLHSRQESRFVLIGKTGGKRILYVVFTARGEKIRIISARDLNKKERKLYEKAA